MLDLEIIKSYNSGVHVTEAAKYIATSFGLNSNQVDFQMFTSIFRNNTETKKHMSDFFTKKLVNNHATIFLILVTHDKTTTGHFLIAFTPLKI